RHETRRKSLSRWQKRAAAWEHGFESRWGHQVNFVEPGASSGLWSLCADDQARAYPLRKLTCYGLRPRLPRHVLSLAGTWQRRARNRKPPPNDGEAGWTLPA